MISLFTKVRRNTIFQKYYFNFPNIDNNFLGLRISRLTYMPVFSVNFHNTFAYLFIALVL